MPFKVGRSRFLVTTSHHSEIERRDEIAVSKRLQRMIRTLLLTKRGRCVLLAFSFGVASFLIWGDILPRHQDLFGDEDFRRCRHMHRPAFVYQHPYVTSSYYRTTCDTTALSVLERKLRLISDASAGSLRGNGEEAETRFAIARPFCEFDTLAIPPSFDVWNTHLPCDVNMSRDEGVPVDLFLVYSQTYSENPSAVETIDRMISAFYDETTSWAKCFDNMYAIETVIPQEVDIYIPSAREELYNWVNGPNRQFEGLYRIINTGHWGDYGAFYLMEGDAVPLKPFWLDALWQEVETKRPFAILGSNFKTVKYNQNSSLSVEPLSQLIVNVTCGNSIYNISHPLLEAFVSQLEVEAPTPYNSESYDFRLVQLLEEGRTGQVPPLPPKIMLNEEGNTITLANNTAMLKKWVARYSEPDLSPFKETTMLRSNGPINLHKSDLGDEHIIHGARMYESWTDHKETHPIALVISNTNWARTKEIVASVEEKKHPFGEIVVIASYREVESNLSQEERSRDAHGEDGYFCHELCQRDIGAVLTNLIKGKLSVQFQERQAGKIRLMDKCQAKVSSDWFMVIDSELSLRDHAKLLAFEARPRKMQRARDRKTSNVHAVALKDVSPVWHPVVPFRPATYFHAFQYPHLNAVFHRTERFIHFALLGNEEAEDFHGYDPRFIFSEWDVPYHAELRDLFCDEWMHVYGVMGEWTEGEPGGPTATDFMAFVQTERAYRFPYRLTDMSIYTTYSPFVLSNSDIKEEREKRYTGEK